MKGHEEEKLVHVLGQFQLTQEGLVFGHRAK